MRDKQMNQTPKDSSQLRKENQQLLTENQQLRQRIADLTEAINQAKANSEANIPSVQYPDNWYRVPFVEAKAILLIVDPEHQVIIDANPAACQFYGYTYQEMVGKRISDINTAAHENLIHALNQAVKGSRPLFLFNHRLADGSIRQVEVDSSPIRINSHTYLFSIIHDVSDRLKIENALRESEAKFKLLVESAVDGIVLMDDSGLLTLTNPRFCELMDCQCGQVSKPQYFCEIFQPDQTDLIHEQIREVKKNHKARLNDITIIRPDGSFFEVDIQLFLLPGEVGDPDQIVAYLRDITQERKDQRVIQQNEEHLRTISELISDEVFALTRSDTGEISIEWDTSSLQLIDEKIANEDRKKVWQELLSPESKQKITSVLTQQFEMPSIQTTDVVIKTSADAERTLRVFTRSVVETATGKVTKVVGAVKDITEQVHAERSLASSENLFRSIFEFGPTGMVTVALNGDFLNVNPAFCEMLGYSREELLRKTVYDVTSPSFLKETRDMYEVLRMREPDFKVQEKEYIRKDGTKVWGRVQGSLVLDEKNHPDYFIMMVSNFTEQKEALEKLRQNEELISNTIANVSVVLFVIDSAGKFLLSEGKGLALLNLKPGEVVGQNYKDVYAGHTVILEAVENSSKGEFVETKVVLGETIFETYFSPYTDKQGNISGTVGIAVDITEKERAQEKLRESEEKYTSIFETCPIPLTISNYITGELVDVNQEFLDEYGYTREEVIGHTASSLGIYAYPESRDYIVKTIQETGQINHFELETRGKNGEPKVMIYAAKKLKYNNQDYLLSVSSNITSQKQNELELFTSRQMLQSILDHIPQRVFWKDTQHRYMGANRQYLMDAGFKSFDLIAGKSDDQLFESAYNESFKATDNIVIENDAPYLDYEELQPVIGDKVLWVRTNKIPLHDQQGKVNMILGTYEDMTDIREAQMKLKASEERFRNLAVHAPVGIYEKDRNHIPVFENQRLLDMIGFSTIETEKDDWMQGIYPEDLAAVRADWEATILEGKDYYGEYRRFKPDGSIIWVADHEKVIRNQIGEIVGYLGTLSDITQIKLAEENLKQSLSLQTATLDSTTDGILAVNLDGTITSFNQKFVDLWNVSPDHLPNQNYSSLIGKLGEHLIDSDIFEQNERLIRLDYAEKSFEVLLLNDGRVVEESSLPQVLDGRIVGRVWSYRDVTARYRNEEKLRMNNLEMQEMIKRLSALRNIDMAITGHTTFIDVIKEIIPNVASSTNADAVALLLPHPGGKHLYVVGQQGLRLRDKPERDLNNFLIDLGGKFAGKAFRTRQTVWVDDLRLEQASEFNIYTEAYAGYVAIPLIVKNEVKGVLEVFTKAPASEDFEMREFLHSLAMQVTIAIDNADLFSRMERTNLDLLAAYEATIEGWARALELRDKETLGHSERVVHNTIYLASKMGVSDNDLIQLRRGVFLHDIGKMAVPDSILLKPGPLTDDEWVIMKMHPSYAYEMLVGIPYLRHALDVPYCHHEKWDGTGYPRGLKAENIPLSARIFSVVDVWDALTSKRPYRPAWPEQQAKTYLMEQSGKQFDPKVVEIFLKMLDNNEQGFER